MKGYIGAISKDKSSVMINVDGKEWWYNVPEDLAFVLRADKGDSIEYTYDKSADGKQVIKTATITADSNDLQFKSKEVPKDSKEEYWVNKDKKDDLKQISIDKWAALGRAIERTSNRTQEFNDDQVMALAKKYYKDVTNKEW